MPFDHAPIYALNRGLISPLGLARTDLKRQALSADVMTNWTPRLLGSMMLRPGLGYITSSNGDLRPKYLPWVFRSDDTNLLEFTDSVLEVLIPGGDGTPSQKLTRAAVSSVITNGDFATMDLTGWTDNGGVGSSSYYVNGSLGTAGIGMLLQGTNENAASRYQLVSVAPADFGVEHALRIFVPQGKVTLNIGTGVPGAGDYAFNLSLGTGYHSIAFTPDTFFYVQLSNSLDYPSVVGSIEIEAAGVMQLPTPYTAAKLSPCLLRTDQSAEVMYVACEGLQQRKILRWGSLGNNGNHSWSIELYQPDDGPFNAINISPITFTCSASEGVGQVTASAAFFQPTHVGAIFRMQTTSAEVDIAAGGANQWSSPIEVTGVGQQRNCQITITGTFVATVVLQQSIGEPGDWTDVGTVAPGTAGIPTNANWTSLGNASAWTAPIAGTFNDGWDNQIIYYRIGIKAAYTSGTANCQMISSNASQEGVFRVISYASPTFVGVAVITLPDNTGVLSGIGANTSTTQWWEGIWSDYRGWPTCVALWQGRLWWGGKSWIIGSVSDAYESFDDTITGDSGPIVEQVGSGPIDVANWLLPLVDLIMGLQSAEKDVRSSVLGSIVTPTQFSMIDASTQGSAKIPGVKVDYNGIYVDDTATRVYQLQFSPSFFQLNYQSIDLTKFVPDIAIAEQNSPLATKGFYTITVSRKPDTRLHAVMNDGTARVLVFEPLEEEQCWFKIASPGAGGKIVDVVRLPGPGAVAGFTEDLVYYVVQRTIQGTTKYYLERFAEEIDCWGGPITKCVDSFLSASGSPTTTLSLPHLKGQVVCVWADGVDQGTYTVDAGTGNVTLPNAVSNWCAGLAYTAQFRSTKLAYQTTGTVGMLAEKKNIRTLGVILANTHYQGLKYGRDFDHLDDLPQVFKGAIVAANTVYSSYDDAGFPFGGTWDTDSRLCLQAASPRPATVLAAVMDIEEAA